MSITGALSASVIYSCNDSTINIVHVDIIKMITVIEMNCMQYSYSVTRLALVSGAIALRRTYRLIGRCLFGVSPFWLLFTQVGLIPEDVGACTNTTRPYERRQAGIVPAECMRARE